jgi:serine/threonine-protein kinase ATR
MYFLTDQ